jgi:hypothetical protein
MVRQQSCGAGLWKTLAVMGISVSLAGCSLFQSPEPEVKVVTKIEKTQVPTVARPKPVQLVDTRVRVVTKDNLEMFLSDFQEQYGEVALVVLSMQDYQNLALNVAEMRRFINQQTQIIVYYEDALTPEPNKDDKTVSETQVGQ